MKSIFIIFLMSFCFSIQAQTTDPEIQKLMETNSTPTSEQGVNLIQSGQYQQANQYFSTEINKDESNRTAYFNRGVANWELSDTMSACKDWSSVLALGDTAMFNLLESKCHSSMIIEEDTLPAKQYKKIFASDSEAGKNAKTVVEVMPSFPGGQDSLMAYLMRKTPKLGEGKRGTVYVIFTVSPKGKVLYPYVKHGLGGTYDKAALQLIRNMPNWKPGKQKGKPVYVKSGIPIRFS